jgi:hypothetical protein
VAYGFWGCGSADVRDKLPKGRQPPTKRAFHAMMYAAESQTVYERELTRFATEDGAKYPRAIASLTTDWAGLLGFCDFPAEHGKHSRPTNPVESTFVTVQLRERATKDAGSRMARSSTPGSASWTGSGSNAPPTGTRRALPDRPRSTAHESILGGAE